MEQQPRRLSRPMLSVLVSSLVVLAVLLGFVLWGPGRGRATSPTAVEALVTARSSSTYTQPTAVASVITPQVPTPVVSVTAGVVSTPVSESEALDELERASSESPAIVAGASGRWVAQLASKHVGIVDPQQRTAAGTHTFLASDIWAEHLSLNALVAQRDPDASLFLLNSTSFGVKRSVKGHPYWMTIAIRDNFTDAASVSRWCADLFPKLSGAALTNHCLPVQLHA